MRVVDIYWYLTLRSVLLFSFVSFSGSTVGLWSLSSFLPQPFRVKSWMVDLQTSQPVLNLQVLCLNSLSPASFHARMTASWPPGPNSHPALQIVWVSELGKGLLLVSAGSASLILKTPWCQVSKKALLTYVFDGFHLLYDSFRCIIIIYITVNILYTYKYI